MNLLYFAWVRSHIGHGEEQLTPPPDVTTVEALRVWLCAQSPGHAQALGTPERLRVAVNQAYVGWTHPITPQDEIAFFPPVTGG